MPIRDASTVKYAKGDVVMDSEKCGWDRHVGQTVFSFYFCHGATVPSGPGPHYRSFTITHNTR
jgi:hypothetical protein